MTSVPLSCAAFEALLPDLLESSLPPADCAAADRHLASCAACRALHDDLRRIEADAATLPSLAPSRDLWPDIAARLDARAVVPLPAAVPAAPARRRPLAWRAAAAAAFLVVGAGAAWIGVASIGAGGAGIGAAGSQAGAAVAAAARRTAAARVRPVSAADPRRALADDVAHLEATLDARRPELDSATVAVIERNLRIIDAAIAEAEAAIAEAPASAFLDRQLATVLARKRDLLRRAALLPART